MAFQWVFDQATTISIDLKAQVGQTITRNQTVRAVSRGNAIRKFTVELPNGLRWEDISSASYTVICVQLPQWTINPGRIVTWSAPFVFYESTV